KQKAKVFLNNLDFHSHFLDELCALEEQKPVLICDGPGSSTKVQRMASDSAVRIYTIHTNHLNAPHTLGSELKSSDGRVLMNENRQSPIVVLTNKQKIDIEAQFPELEWNIHVISHAMPVEQQQDQLKKVKNRIVVASRLSEEKRLNLLIDAFKKTAEEVPDAELHIYGVGPEKVNLQEQIKKLKLRKKVKLLGYTIEPKQKLAEALFTVNTSIYEGQSLTMLEAMAGKTAVLSFKINYLVRELYEDGLVGEIVPNGDIERLSEAMTDWLYDPEKAVQYGERGQAIIAKEYSVQKQYQDWDRLITSELEKLS
ncbi:MAG: glycosyltransferase, partial [Kurthia sp.]